jgi:putative transposase
MPRLARLRITGYPLHVIQRGNDRANCFRRHEDYVLYLGLVNELAPMFECELHAYVLMTNHVHMLLTPRTPDGPSRLMQNLGQRYVQHFNRAHLRTGTLWEGRFRSSVIDSERYLFTCQRYIELNPVRAGIVRNPWEYPWSSYRANANREPSVLITPHFQYHGLGRTPEERAASYRDFFRDPLSERVIGEIRTAANGGFALGDAEFIKALERATSQRACPGVGGRPRKGAHEKPGSDPGFGSTVT